MRALALPTLLLSLVACSACSGAPTKPASTSAMRIEAPPTSATGAKISRRSPYAPAQEDVSKRGNYTRGGLYAPEIQDSAPDGLAEVDLIPEPEVSSEPRSLYGNRSPYVVLGKTYNVLNDASGYNEVGLASYYGNKFHGRRTSDLEVYDMYAFSAAHKTLPLPSFARVTNLANGKSVIVRVNDRGPFHEGRIIDLSYAAAVKLGVDRVGTARVEVRGLGAGENAREPADTAVARGVLPPLPSGAHVATGRPAIKIEGAQPASAIDTLLSALPIASADAAGHSPQVAPTADLPSTGATQTSASSALPHAGGERFDMLQDGRAMSADEFDHWMRSRQLRVATGKPGIPDKNIAAASAPLVAQPPAKVPLLDRETTAAADAAGSDALTFQIASFAARTNAEHALAMLNGAGIDGARLLDADANGRKVWRLRVGPVAPAAAQELVARIQGLGFGQPQRVRE